MLICAELPCYNLSYYCLLYIYNGVILHAHPVRGESHNQRNATGEVATVVLGTWKINKMRLVRMAEKGSKTILHRGFTESIKNILKTIKLTENTDNRKAMAIQYIEEASDGQEHWLMHWGWLKLYLQNYIVFCQWQNKPSSQYSVCLMRQNRHLR